MVVCAFVRLQILSSIIFVYLTDKRVAGSDLFAPSILRRIVVENACWSKNADEYEFKNFAMAGLRVYAIMGAASIYICKCAL